jgi:DNA polymerase V
MSLQLIGTYKEGVRLLRPLLLERIAAGFPSPAEGWVERRIDLNQQLIRHPDYTFYMRVTGDSMSPRLEEGDILIVDRACEVEDEDIIIARIAADFTVKQFCLIDGRCYLKPLNCNYEPIPVSEDLDAEIWGKVIWSLRSH